MQKNFLYFIFLLYYISIPETTLCMNLTVKHKPNAQLFNIYRKTCLRAQEKKEAHRILFALAENKEHNSQHSAFSSVTDLNSLIKQAPYLNIDLTDQEERTAYAIATKLNNKRLLNQLNLQYAHHQPIDNDLSNKRDTKSIAILLNNFPDIEIVDLVTEDQRDGNCYSYAIKKIFQSLSDISNEQFNNLQKHFLTPDEWRGLIHDCFEPTKTPVQNDLAIYYSYTGQMLHFGVVAQPDKIQSKTGQLCEILKHNYWEILAQYGNFIKFYKLKKCYHNATQLIEIINNFLHKNRNEYLYSETVLNQAQQMLFTLADGQTPNVKTYSLCSIFDPTCFNSNSSFLDFFLKVKINYQNDDGTSALHIAANRGNFTFIVNLLLYKTDLTLKNNHNQTAYEIAKEKNHIGTQYLLKAYPRLTLIKQNFDAELHKERIQLTLSDNYADTTYDEYYNNYANSIQSFFKLPDKEFETCKQLVQNTHKKANVLAIPFIFFENTDNPQEGDLVVYFSTHIYTGIITKTNLNLNEIEVESTIGKQKIRHKLWKIPNNIGYSAAFLSLKKKYKNNHEAILKKITAITPQPELLSTYDRLLSAACLCVSLACIWLR